MPLTLQVLPDTLAVCRLAPTAAVPPWAAGKFRSITWTADELSIVCEQRAVPPEVQAERQWRALQVVGPLDFALTGVLRDLAVPLATAQISIFAVSTFDTDYLLVKADTLAEAVAVLQQAGHTVA